MKKGVVLKRFLIGLFIFGVLAHSAVHLIVYGTGIPGFGKGGVSGFSIGKFEIGEELEGAYSLQPMASKLFLLVEWLFVMAIAAGVYAKQKVEIRNEVREVKLPMVPRRGGIVTDIDKLYYLLSVKKHLKLSTIMTVFKVDRQTALEWCRALEAGDLATVEYPRMGEPEIVLNEEKGGENEKETEEN